MSATTPPDYESATDLELAVWAAQAMGWEFGEDESNLRTFYYGDDRTGPMYVYRYENRFIVQSGVWNPAQDANQAIELAEHVRSQCQDSFWIVTRLSGSPNIVFDATFFPRLEPDSSWVKHKDPLLGRCLTIAALKAHDTITEPN